MVEFFEDLMVSIVQPTIKKLREAVHSWVTAGSQNSRILARVSVQRGGTAPRATRPIPPARRAYHSLEAPSQVVREVRVPGVILSG